MSPIPLALSGMLGALLGFAAAALWLGDEQSPLPSVMPMPLQPSLKAEGAPPPSVVETRSRRIAAGDHGGGGGDGTADEERKARAAELGELRARARAAQEQLSLGRRRIAQLESELADQPNPRQERSRHEFDLDREDWRQMAADGVMKYRVPCETTDDDALAPLALPPDDRDVLKRALANSAARLRNGLLPLCAAALGGRTDVAQTLSTDSCRQVLMGTASERSESPLLSAHHVAAFMAGDAPRPGDDSSLTERMFLVLAEEPKKLEDELAETFGPEEAHRLAFSEGLCFRTSTHNYVHRRGVTGQAATPGSGVGGAP